MVDQLNLERLGVPTLTIATTELISLATSVAQGEGAKDISLVSVPHPIGMILESEVLRKAEAIFPEVMGRATEQRAPPQIEKTHPTTPFPARTFNLVGTVQELNDSFFEQGWSLGIPIVPPTPDLVSKMLGGTSRQPNEILGSVPPLMGVLTIELVAIHAVMAGCKPEYMPVLVAALEALLESDANWRGASATTGSAQVVVIVNGPIVGKIGIGCDQGAAGKGHVANGSIGYALNLVSYIVGGSRPPSPDKSTLGTPADYVSWVFGENEERLPKGWEPFHVERGFEKSDSVVSVLVTYPPIDNIDHYSTTPQEHVRWWSHLVGPLHNIGGPCSPQMILKHPLVALGPEHASLLSSTGWTKDDFRRALWESARIPLSVWPQDCPGMGAFVKDYGISSPQSLVSITRDPGQFDIVIAGGVGKHSHYFPPFSLRAVSKIVRP